MPLLLTRCCCCFSLSTGTITIGVLVMINGTISLVTTLSAGASQDPKVAQVWQGKAHVFIIGLPSLVLIVASALMIYGTITDRRGFLVPWLILFGLGVLGLAGLFVFMAMRDVDYVSGFVLVAICFYFWYVVFSLFKSLDEGD